MKIPSFIRQIFHSSSRPDRLLRYHFALNVSLVSADADRYGDLRGGASLEKVAENLRVVRAGRSWPRPAQRGVYPKKVVVFF